MAKEKNNNSHFLTKAEAIVMQNLDDSSFSSTDLASQLGISRYQLYRKLSKYTSKSGSSYIRSIRLREAKRMLSELEESVSSIGYMVGFSSPTYFNRTFKEEYGVTPGDVRNGKKARKKRSLWKSVQLVFMKNSRKVLR